MMPVRTVKIIPEPKHPFKILEVRARNGKDIRFELKPISGQEQNGYELVVENLKKTKGRYSDTIILKTDSAVKPEIKIHVYGDILEKPKKRATPKKMPPSPLTQPSVDVKPPADTPPPVKAKTSKDIDATVPKTETKAQPSVTPTKESSDKEEPKKEAAPSSEDKAETDSSVKTAPSETAAKPEATPPKETPTVKKEDSAPKDKEKTTD